MPDTDPETRACVILVTCSKREEAEAIAETIVTERLAACVNVVGLENPILSFYIWEQTLQKDAEILLIIKTVKDRLPQLENRIQELHSYAVPEFLALPVLTGSKAYLNWLFANVESGGQ